MIIPLCEEHFEESCFIKSVDLKRRLVNSKDEFIFNFVFVLQHIVAAFSMLFCLLGRVVSYAFYGTQPAEVN